MNPPPLEVKSMNPDWLMYSSLPLPPVMVTVPDISPVTKLNFVNVIVPMSSTG
jgi:hypothetical protein